MGQQRPNTTNPDAASTIDVTKLDTTQHAPSEVFVRFDCPVCEGAIEAQATSTSFEFSCPHCNALIMTPAIGIGAGTVLDDFRLIRRIGRGAMGEVYVANQRSLSRMVAVKILSPGLTSSPEQVERFQREIQNLARLQHPNIVTAFYAGKHDEVYYLAMSYVDGENVHTCIHRQGRLPEEEALSVTYKVADALRYAWEQHGFVHRDIKPANIMIDTTGEVKLTDLGLSKFVYEESSATHGHRIFGTPHYMSPEQARGELDIDFRSDMYSLGVTLYHMLAGQPPFEGEDMHTLLKRQLKEQPPPIRAVRPDLSRAAEAILTRLLAKNLNDRYDSWDALMSAVSEALSDLPLLAQHGPADDYATREVLVDARLRARRRPRVVATLAIVIAAAGLAGWLMWSARLSPTEDPSLPAFVRHALEHTRTPPEHLNSAIEILRDQLGRTVNAAEQAHLQRSMQRLKRDRIERVREVIDHLDERAHAHLHAGRPDHAVAVYLDYDGPWAEESRAERIARAEAYVRPTTREQPADMMGPFFPEADTVTDPPHMDWFQD